MNTVYSQELNKSPHHESIHILEALFKHLTRYADPKVESGYFPVFVDWVVREWATRPYFMVERFSSNFEIANFPVRTDFVLKEMQPTYRDYFHSLNGRHHFSPVAVNGTNCETIERDFYDFFHESMRLEGIRFLAETFPDIDSEDFWDRIFLEEFEGREEIELMDKLCMYFGFYGRAAEPYTCLPPDVESSHPGFFADWYFEDFRFAQGQAPTSGKPKPWRH